MTQKEGGIF